MTVKFVALATEPVRALQNGGLDAYGLQPEKCISDGEGIPCRHCFRNVAKGESYLVLAFRPFPALQPYAETGPIFLHAAPCERAVNGRSLPEILNAPEYIIRGYGPDNRIIYGSGAVTPTHQIASRAVELLQQPEIAYVHIRSARNNCYQCRVERR